LGWAHFFFLFFLFPQASPPAIFPYRAPSTLTPLPCPHAAQPGAATPGTCHRPDPPPLPCLPTLSGCNSLPPPPSTPDPPSCSLSTQPKTEPPEPSLLFLLSVRADGTRSKPSPPSPPLVAYSSTPTIGAPPLTRNLAAPPGRNKILVKVH
jgi:hypothetical protein